MKNEHPGIDHVWACRQINGQMGEIRNFIKLSDAQVSLIQTDPKTTEQVCPGGEVVCDSCEIPFLGGIPSYSSLPTNYNELSDQLVHAEPLQPQQE